VIGGLTQAERAVADCARTGDLCRVAGVDSATETRIRPAVLEALLRGRLKSDDGDEWVTHPRGVTLAGGYIDGDLVQAYVTRLRPLTLVDCTLGVLDLTAAAIPQLVLRRCTLGGIRADAAGVEVRVAVESCTVRGTVTMADATVGTVSLCGTEILSGGEPQPGDDHGVGPQAGFVLDARRLNAVGDVLLDPDPDTGRAFAAHGPVTLVDARIGHFGARGARILGVDGYGNSLVAERLHATGSVHLAEGLTTAGAVRLVGAKIGNRLSVRGAEIGANHIGEALVADDIEVGGRVDLSDGVPDGNGEGRTSQVVLAGRVGFADARMRGLQVAGTTIMPPGRRTDALIVDRAVILGDVVIGPGVELGGAVRLDGAAVDGTIACRDAVLGMNRQRESFSADHVKASGHVQFDGGTRAAGALRLLSAHVDGQLRLLGCVFGPNNHGSALFADDLHCEGPVELADWDGAPFDIRGEVHLARAQLGGLRCTEGTIGGTADEPGSLSLEQSVVKGDVSLAGNLVVAGTVRLRGAEIRGQLSLRGTRVAGRDPQGNAVVADAASVTGDVMLDADDRRPFTAAGAVRLQGATVGGGLSLRGASVTGADGNGYAISAGHLNVTGGLRANAVGAHRLELAGAVRLADSRLGGLHLSGGEVNGQDGRGYALAAHAVQVAGEVRLGPDLTLAGATSLLGAGMNKLRCEHVTLGTGSRPASLTLNSAVVRGNVDCAAGFTADGPVWMFGLTVRGRMTLDGADIRRGQGRAQTGDSLVANSLDVAGDLSLWGVRTQGPVSLRNAKVGGTLHVTYAGMGGPLSLAGAGAAVLHDRLGTDDGRGGRAAPALPEIDLVGFRYGHLSRESNLDARHRRSWLNRRPGGRFHSQPHEHLASVYRSQGDAASARRIAIDKHQRQTRDARRWRMQRLPRWVFFFTVGHGYRPWLAGVWAVLVIGAFAAVVDRADAAHIMIQNRPAAADAPPTVPFEPHDCDPRWPCLNPIGFAADAFFPGVSLEQEVAWRPDAATGYGQVLRGVQWVVAALGWLLATIFVAAVAGVVRRQ
jgi:hypothetical protein